jgi:hypothetical protein
MKRAVHAVITAMMLLLTVTSAVASKPQTTEELKAKAATAHGGDRAKLYTEVAAREVEDANTQFNNGDVEKAHALVNSAVQDATEAADTARTTGKRLKRTEIAIHKLARRLEDIRRTLALEDQQALKKAVDQLDKVDRALIDAMFGLKEKDSE